MQINFLNRYLYFPNTWLHNVNSNSKLNVISVILYFISYMNLQYLIAFFILSFLTFLSLNLPKKYLLNSFKVLLIILIPYILTILIKQAISSRVYSQNIHIYTSYLVKLRSVPDTRNNIYINKYIIQITCQSHYFPRFILKGIVISVINFLLLYILFTTTVYEDIILYIINFHRFISFYTNFNKKYTIMVACSSQFLEDIINYIYKIFISLKIRNYSNMELLILIIYSITSLIKFIKVYSYNLSTTIYTRFKYIEK
uniref:Uncharacterized protein n=1 Tax=Gelidium vagum TaxID=35171 RepID=A0A141SDZ5_GELVA|nr:hypothetical protein Gvag_051 [Gelidium vagum]AMK96513.1 hypothetical protein Gvag_051 [Gelidium vagum]